MLKYITTLAIVFDGFKQEALVTKNLDFFQEQCAPGSKLPNQNRAV